jgi:hypothetical protein
LIAHTGARRGWIATARVGAVAALVVAPWIARNYQVHGELVFVKSTFGYAFWQGNCAASHGTDKVVRASVEPILARSASSLSAQNQALWEARHEAGYIDDIALTAADKAALGRLSEPERSRVLWRRSLRELAASPDRYARLCLKRLRYFLLFDDTNPKARHPLYRWPHLWLSLAAAAGLFLASNAQRRMLAPGAAVVAAITLFHTLTIVSARFHIPIEPILAIWAAIALDRLAFLTGDPTVAARSSSSSLAPVAALRFGSSPR